jgi:predicted PurR-regulated permease PerM
MTENKRSTGGILWFFLACFLLSLLLLGKLLLPFLSIIVLGGVITGACSPIYRWLTRWMPGAPASLLTCVLVFIVLVIPIVLFVTILSNEAYGLYQMGRSAAVGNQLKALIAGNELVDRINDFLLEYDYQITGDELYNVLAELGKNVGLFLYNQAQNIATNLLKLLVNLFFMLLVIYFLLIDGERLVSFIKDLSPLPEDQDDKLIQKFKDMAGAVLIGNGLCGLIQGILGGGLFALFGLQSPFLWGVIMGILAFLPILGIGLVFLPAALFLFLKGRIAASVFFVVFYILLSGGIEYLFKPRLVGHRVKMHTLLVFFSIIGGLNLYGILGIVYGPLIVTAFLTFTDIYHSSYQRLIEES